MIDAYSVRNTILRNAHQLGSLANTPEGAHRYIMRHQRHPFRPNPYYSATYGRTQADKNLYLSTRRTTRDKKQSHTIPLGGPSTTEVLKVEHAKHPRRRNWRPPVPSRGTATGSWTSTINCGQYSYYRRAHTKWEYEPRIQSLAIIRGKLGLEFHYAGTTTFLQPPAGYKWDLDHDGIRLVAVNDPDKDYHVNSDDLRNYSKKAIREKALNNYRVRAHWARQQREQRRQTKQTQKEEQILIKKAQAEGLMVCLKDSLKAGNCLQGTLSFGYRFKLDPKKHYPPDQILKLADDYDKQRAKLVILTGLRRHRQEMSRGYALLEDHLPPETV